MCIPGGSDYQKWGVVMKHVRGTYASVTVTASTFAVNWLSVGMECTFYCWPEHYSYCMMSWQMSCFGH